jgi:aspartate carbamoyltransferase catalytic subunit
MNEFRLTRLVAIEDLSRTAVELILGTAESFLDVTRRAVRKTPALRGKTVVNVFYEPSTRTRTSFELAGKRLSADVVNINVATSSTQKGETLRDSLATIDAMHADVLVVRHSVSGSAKFLADRMRAVVVNAGDGMHEHPTQALLDAFTMRRHKARIEGLEVAICGDIAHSRVARSNVALLHLLGAKVRLAGPRTLLPRGVETFGCPVFDRIEPAIQGADVVMMLRVQQERLAGAMLPSLREYARVWGLNRARLCLARSDALVMHPGPMNRGVEIADDVADCEKSVILEQVEAGVAVRMAVLYLCAKEPGETPL